MKKNRFTQLFSWLGFGAGLPAAYALAVMAWVAQQVSKVNVRETLSGPLEPCLESDRLLSVHSEAAYQVKHSIEEGIEHIHYRPHQPRFHTPILFQHGMWHGAWCWRWWQELFAEWGWESIAISLPGHGASPARRPIKLCTLDYYLKFIQAEIMRMPVKPVLVGHSMGGALTQWYLKYVGDDLPAAVFLASWVAQNVVIDGFWRFVSHDPALFPLMMLSRDAVPMVRNPQRAASLLITENALLSPEELFARLGPESGLVTYQHNYPLWSPPENLKSPLLWVAAALDYTVSLSGNRASAEFYQAHYLEIENAGHNLMMEHNYRETACQIHKWLVEEADVR